MIAQDPVKPQDQKPGLQPGPILRPEDPRSLHYMEELDRALRHPTGYKQALDYIRDNVRGLVLLDNLAFQQEQMNAAALQQQDQQAQQQQQVMADQMRASDLEMAMRTAGSRIPEMREDFDAQILSLQGRVPDEQIAGLRSSMERIPQFASLQPALEQTMRRAGSVPLQKHQQMGPLGKLGEIGKALASGVTGQETGLTSDVSEAMRQKLKALESSFFDSPADWWSLQGTRHAKSIDDIFAERESLFTEPGDKGDVSISVPGAPKEPKPRTVAKIPAGMTREEFRMFGADAMAKVLDEITSAGKPAPELPGEHPFRVDPEEAARLIGQLAPFGAIGKAGKVTGEATKWGLRWLGKKVPALAAKVVNAGAQTVMAYEYGANYLDLPATTRTELERMTPAARDSAEAMYRQQAGITTAAILPIMAMAMGPLGSQSKKLTQVILGQSPASSAIARGVGAGEEAVAGAVSGATLPAVGEVADMISRSLPTERAQFLADQYAAMDAYGPLEHMLRGGTSEQMSRWAHEYAQAAKTPMVALGALHALRAIGANRVLNGRDKMALRDAVRKEVEAADLQGKEAVLAAADRDLDAVSKTKEQDEARVVGERLAEAVGGAEHARKEVDERLLAERLSHHEGKTLEDKAAAIREKLNEPRPGDVIEDNALLDELSAVRAFQRGDVERGEQLLRNAKDIREGRVEPMEPPPDESTPETKQQAQAVVASVDVARESKGVEAAKEIVAERREAPALEEVKITDDETAVVVKTPEGKEKTIQAPDFEKLRPQETQVPAEPAESGGGALGQETVRPAPIESKRKGQQRRADAELLSMARDLQREHRKVTPDLLQKALAIGKKRAEGIVKALETEAAEPARKVGGYVRTKDAIAAGKVVIGKIKAIDGDQVTVQPRRGKAFTARADELVDLAESGLAAEVEMVTKANRSAAAKKKFATTGGSRGMLQFIADAGGIRRDNEVDAQFKDSLGHKVGLKRLFTKGGKTLGEMEGMLADAGYPVGSKYRGDLTAEGQAAQYKDLRDVLWDALTGDIDVRAAGDENFIQTQIRHMLELEEAKDREQFEYEKQELVSLLGDRAEEVLESAASRELSDLETIDALRKAAGVDSPEEVRAEQEVADAVVPSPVEGMPTPVHEAVKVPEPAPEPVKPRRGRKRAGKTSALDAKAEELAGKEPMDDAAAQAAYEALRREEVRLEGEGVTVSFEGDELKRFEGGVRRILDDVRNADDYAELVRDFGPTLKGADGLALRFSKEGRELLAKIKAMGLKWNGEAGGTSLHADIADAIAAGVRWAVDMAMGRPSPERIERFAKTVRGTVPVRTNPFELILEPIRTGIGNFGGLGAEKAKLLDAIGIETKAARSALAKLRRRYPQGSDRMEQLVLTEQRLRKSTDEEREEEGFGEHQKLWDAATPAERSDAAAVSELLDKAQPLLSWRKGVVEDRHYLRYMQQSHDALTAKEGAARERAEKADEALSTAAADIDKIERKALEREARNARSQSKRATDAIEKHEAAMQALAERIEKTIEQTRLRIYWPHIATFSREEMRAMRAMVTDAPIQPGQVQRGDGSYRPMFLDMAFQGHAKHRTGKLEAEGLRMRDSLDALYFYLTETVPQAKINRWLYENADAINGSRRMIPEDELRRGTDGPVFYQPNADEFAVVRVRGAHYQYDTSWGSLYSKQKLEPEELAKWVMRSPKVAKEIAAAQGAKDPKQAIAAVRAKLEALAHAKPEYVLLTQSPKAAGAPGDRWMPERVGWLADRPDLTATPWHRARFNYYVRDGGLKQRLEAMGEPGARKWDAVRELFGQVDRGAGGLQGATDRALERAGRAISSTILSSTLGLGNVAAAGNALWGAVYVNQSIMGLRRALAHANLPMKFMLRARKLGRRSFAEWVADQETSASPDRPLWEDQGLRRAFLEGVPQRTEAERHVAAAMWNWASDPMHAASWRGQTIWGDIGISRATYPEMIGKLPQSVRNAGRRGYRAARWFVDHGQWAFWKPMESFARAHLYMGSFVDAMRSGYPEAGARKLAQDASIAAHGTFNKVMKSKLMRIPLINALGTVTTWMQHAAGTTLRLGIGQRGPGVEVPDLGATEGRKRLRDGMLHVGDMWARAIVIGQAVAALGLNDDLLPYAQDVSRQMGGTLSEIWFAGDALDAGLQGGATWLLDSLGLTAAKLGRLYDNLSYRSPEFPIPVLPFGFSGPALSLVRSGAQWLDAKLMGNEPRADQAASRLLSMAGGAWLRIARRAGFSTPASDADWREVREMFSGRVTERVRGGTMLRILSDLLPGTPLDEQANWKEKIRARRAGERIRATGATTNAELRAMWREMQATKDPERQASVRARFNETVGRLAEERNMTMGDLKSLVSDLGRNFGYEEVPGRVRDIVTAVTQEEKVRLLSEALTDRWRPLLKDEAEYALARIVGKRKWRQFQAEVPPDQLVNLLSAWDQASLEWGASERPGAPAGSR